MRIAWVVYGALDQATGGYVYDRIVVEGLRARGDIVRVVSIDPARGALAQGLSLARRIGRRRADVVVGDELCHRELGPAFLALRSSIARVLLVHHLSAWEMRPGPRRLLTHARERLAVRASDAYLATSHPTATRLARDHGVRASVALPGADRLPRLPRVTHDGEIELLFVGSFIARKRLRELVSAFAQIGDARAKLVVAGDPDRDPAYAREVRAAAGNARVDLRGVVGPEALAEALARADALVLPSTLEGYGMVLTEAVHAGVPVIVSRETAAAGAVREGEEALVFDDGEAGLARGLRTFLGDAALRARMRDAAERRAGELPRWAQTVDAVRDVLARAVAAR